MHRDGNRLGVLGIIGLACKLLCRRGLVFNRLDRGRRTAEHERPDGKRGNHDDRERAHNAGDDLPFLP